MNTHAGAAYEPSGLRLSAPVGLAESESAVDRAGGKYKAGLIRRFSVIQRGEAKGHRLWIDSDFLQQVSDAFTSKGLRSRWTHPGLSSDGMGTQIGRAFDAEVVGDKVLADLHIQKPALKHERYGEKVMDWAEADPESFGASIVFSFDQEAMDEFAANNVNDNGDFASPDEQNVANYPHARLSRLRYVDVVGDPAANADGLFAGGNALPAEAEAVLAYAFGLTDSVPDMGILGVHPERARIFLGDFLVRHDLSVAQCGGSAEPIHEAGHTAGTEGVDAMPEKLEGLSIERLEAERPDLVGQLKAQGAEEEAKKARDEALAAGRAEGAKLERERQTKIIAFAHSRKVAVDDEVVKAALSEDLSVEDAETRIRDRRIALLEAQTFTSPGASPEPVVVPDKPAAYAKGMTAEAAWEADVELPGVGRVQSQFSAKERFCAWAEKDPEGQRFFGA